MNREDAKKRYGENLKRLRIARGMSQEELAKALGYTNRSSINKIEIGRSNIPTDKIARTAEVLGVSPLELFDTAETYEVSMIPQETLPAGTYRGSADVVADDGKITALMEKLSPNNQEKLKEYAQFLLQQQEGKK